MKKTLLTVLLSVIITLGIVKLAGIGSPADMQKETTFERVLRTGTIRCGYPVWPPSLSIDPNTKKISGYTHDIAEAVAEKLGLKIKWVEEVAWGTAEQGMNAGRYDMVCGDVALDAQRTKSAWYSTSFNHNPNYVFVRKDDSRFDKDYKKLNDPSVKFAVLPNTILDFSVRDRFPNAARLDTNDFQGTMDILMMVVSGKADASINMLLPIEQYNAQNPDHQVKIVGPAVRYSSGGFLLPKGDMDFKQLIDNAILELSISEEIRDIMRKYMPDDRRYWLSPAKAYEE
ncbi:MAG: transporter substrate-binding domain-containing protein [Alphaproteobacteria bacterium]|nr:transporter substrate-binding domain-containing protein [Alphaproteobacteria bacterium]